MTLRVAVHGSGGRMGRSVLSVLAEAADLEIAAGVDATGSPTIGADLGALAGGTAIGIAVSDSLDALIGADVVIDFSLPEASRRVVEWCSAQQRPCVIGTTGLDGAAERAIMEAALRIPLVWAPNFSQGVTLLFHLAARAAELLGPDFDAEIVEMHHRHKIDAPSGTAVRLSEVVATAKGIAPSDVVHGRSGRVGVRPPSEIGVMTLRGGDVVGDHTLILAGPGERIELTHRAHTREIFARGAVRAARWVVGQAPGRYDMTDVMSL